MFVYDKVTQFDWKRCIEDTYVRCETDAEIPILSIMEAIFEVLKQVPLEAAEVSGVAEHHNTFEQNSNGSALTSDCNLAWHLERLRRSPWKQLKRTTLYPIV